MDLVKIVFLSNMQNINVLPVLIEKLGRRNSLID